MTTYRWALPDLGEGMHEAEIVRWLVQEGDVVAPDQPLLEVQTDKALTEIPSPVAGRVLHLYGVPGQVVPVGTVLIEIDTAMTNSPSAIPRPLAAPAVRRRARELGVDLADVRGTGRGGRITMRDVEEAARQAATGQTVGMSVAPSAAVEAGMGTVRQGQPPGAKAVAGSMSSEADVERVPLAGLRRVIAGRMVASKFTAPHVTGMDEADVTELVALREKLDPWAREQGIKLTYLPFVIRAVVSGLRRFPYLNASMDAEHGEILLKKRYHIGIAVDTPDGLMVPVIRDADQKSLLDLAQEVQRLSEAARSRTIALEDVQGSTFTISNVGSFGGTFATPIINPPEVAILAMGRIARRPMFGPNDEVVPRWLMALSLTFDHRVLDGGYTARFMRHVVERLEHPERLMLEL